MRICTLTCIRTVCTDPLIIVVGNVFLSGPDSRLAKLSGLPFPVVAWMEDGQISLCGDGDGHEDAAGEEDVVEGVEEVGEEEVVILGD